MKKLFNDKNYIIYDNEKLIKENDYDIFFFSEHLAVYKCSICPLIRFCFYYKRGIPLHTRYKAYQDERLLDKVTVSLGNTRIIQNNVRITIK